jgi:hypothetical protein
MKGGVGGWAALCMTRQTEKLVLSRRQQNSWHLRWHLRQTYLIINREKRYLGVRARGEMRSASRQWHQPGQHGAGA